MGQEYTKWEISRMRERYYEINNTIRKYNSMIDDNNRELSKKRKVVYELQQISKNLKRTLHRLWRLHKSMPLSCKKSGNR